MQATRTTLIYHDRHVYHCYMAEFSTLMTRRYQETAVSQTQILRLCMRRLKQYNSSTQNMLQEIFSVIVLQQRLF